MKNFFSKNFFIVLFLTAAISLTGCTQKASYSSLENGLPTITVQGEGKVEIAPDEAIITFGVLSEEKSLSKAYQANTEKMNLVIKSVKDMAIEDKDIQTSSYSVTPIYQRDEKGYQLPGNPATFRVSQQLTIKVRNLAKVGDIIDKSIENGSNEFNGIQFTSSKIKEFQKEAKIKAAKDAKEKASLLAENLGVKLGGIIRVNESFSPPYLARNVMAFKTAEAAPQIEAGSLEITATCDVIYELINS